MDVLKKWKCQCPFFCSSVITVHFQEEGLKEWQTLRKNLLKSRLARVQLLAVSSDTFWILTFKGSACGSSSRASFSSQGFFLVKGVQQESVCGQLVVKACRLFWVVLKVRVRKRSGRFSALPSKLASILSLKRVWRRFSLLEKREKYWQFWASFRQSVGSLLAGFLGLIFLILGSFK